MPVPIPPVDFIAILGWLLTDISGFVALDMNVNKVPTCRKAPTTIKPSLDGSSSLLGESGCTAYVTAKLKVCFHPV